MADELEHQAFLCRVIDLAAENVEAGGRPFATLIAKDGEIVASGVNSTIALGDPTAHAEILAIRAACARLARLHLSDCTLYTISEPCPMCMGALLWTNVGAVYFAATKDISAACGFTDFYPQFSVPFTNRSMPMRHIAIDSAQEVLWAGRIEQTPP